MNRTWVLLGVIIGLMVLAACGDGIKPTPTGCVELMGDGLVEIPCPSTATTTTTTTVDVPSEPEKEDGVEVTCPPDDGSPEGSGCQLFLEVPQNVAPQALWCYQCHLVEGLSDGLIGPELTHIGAAAVIRKAGMSAEEYLRESIMEPEKFVAPGLTSGLMTHAITEKMTEEQVSDLVAFLLTLE